MRKYWPRGRVRAISLHRTTGKSYVQLILHSVVVLHHPPTHTHRGGFKREVSIERQEESTSHLYYFRWSAYNPPPHTHTDTPRTNETKNNTLECKENDQIFKISHVKNVNKNKNPLTPTKLDSKKQESIGLTGCFGRVIPIDHPGRATFPLYLNAIFNTYI